MVLTVVGLAKGFALFWKLFRSLISIGSFLGVGICELVDAWLMDPFPEVYG